MTQLNHCVSKSTVKLIIQLCVQTHGAMNCTEVNTGTLHILLGSRHQCSACKRVKQSACEVYPQSCSFHGNVRYTNSHWCQWSQSTPTFIQRTIHMWQFYVEIKIIWFWILIPSLCLKHHISKHLLREDSNALPRCIRYLLICPS